MFDFIPSLVSAMLGGWLSGRLLTLLYANQESACSSAVSRGCSAGLIGCIAAAFTGFFGSVVFFEAIGPNGQAGMGAAIVAILAAPPGVVLGFLDGYRRKTRDDPP